MQGIIFMGLQVSGKSSFFLKHFSETHIRLNMDMLKTRHRETILFDACLSAKQPVVIDNTNPRKVDRHRYIQSFNSHQFKIIGYYFASHLNDCLARNLLRQGKDRVPDIGIKGTAKQLQLPNYDEGFDELYYVKLLNDTFNIMEWDNEI